MGNGVSGDQGNLPTHGRRDVSDAPDWKQHDWSELARAPNTNALSLDKRYSYSGARTWGRKSLTLNSMEEYSSSTEADTRSGAYSGAQMQHRKSSVMKDDMQFGAQGDNQLRNRKSPTPAKENSSSGEEDEERRQKTEERRQKSEDEEGRQKTGSVMQVESPDFPVQNVELTQSHSIQTAYTSRRKKTGSAMQVEWPDLQSRSIQTACTSTGSGMQVESLDSQSRSIETACTPSNMAAQQLEEDGQWERRKKPQQKEARSSSTPTETALPTRQLKPTYTPVDVSARSVSGRATAQRMEEKIDTEKELLTLQLRDKVHKVLPEQQQVNDFRQQPETEIKQMSERSAGGFYDQQNFTVMEISAQHTGLEPLARNDSSYREEPLTKPEMRNKERKLLQNDNNDLEHDDVSERRNRKEKTETDAKAGATRHLSRQLNGRLERAIDSADAKVGWTQHPSFGNDKIKNDNNLNQIPSCRRISLNNSRGQDKLPETKTPKQKSACSKRQNMQKCRQDKAEWRRAKRQSRRTGGEMIQSEPSVASSDCFPVTPAENADTTEGAPQNMTKQEVLEKIESMREDFAKLIQQRGVSDPAMRTLMEEFDEVDLSFIEWED